VAFKERIRSRPQAGSSVASLFANVETRRGETRTGQGRTDRGRCTGRPANKPRRRLLLEVEDLEQRRLLSTATLGGSMTLAGDGTAGEYDDASDEEVSFYFPAARVGYSASTTISISGSDDQSVSLAIVDTVNCSIGFPSRRTPLSFNRGPTPLSSSRLRFVR
jgi:hypothetical protein